MGLVTSVKVRKATMSARVYRVATGKWEDLGVVASTSKWYNFKLRIKRWLTTLF